MPATVPRSFPDEMTEGSFAKVKPYNPKVRKFKSSLSCIEAFVKNPTDA